MKVLSPVVTVDTSSWKFVTSYLLEYSCESVNDFIIMLNCKGVVETMDNTVTHMIVQTEDDLKTKRTLKYFQAVASGVTVVSHLWVLACMEDMRNLDRADKWEVKDEGGTNGPMLARKTKEEGREPLLSGFEVGIKGEIEGLENSCIYDLLSRAGARAVLNKTQWGLQNWS